MKRILTVIMPVDSRVISKTFKRMMCEKCWYQADNVSDVYNIYIYIYIAIFLLSLHSQGDKPILMFIALELNEICMIICFKVLYQEREPQAQLRLLFSIQC